MERTLSLREQIVAGVIAGLAGWIVTEALLFASMIPSGEPLRGLLGSFAFASAMLLGGSAYASPAAVPLGILLHLCAAIGWALGYVYLVRTQPYLLKRPWISGIGFGLVVAIFMQIVLLAGGQYRLTSPAALNLALLTPVFCYGIPVALTVSRLLRAPLTSSGQT